MIRLRLIALSLVPAFASGQQSTFDISFGGNKSGETVMVQTPDGKVSSKMSLKIGSLLVTSSLEGLVKDGMLVEAHVESSQGGTNVRVDWKDGKYTVVRGGKEVAKDQPYKPSLKAVLSAFHPGISSMVFQALKGEAKKTKVLWVDSLVELELEFKGRNQTVKTAAGPISAEFWEADLSGTKMTFAFDPAGKVLGVDVPSQKIQWVLRGYDGVFADPLAAYPELSQPQYKIQTERRVRMKTRDGVSLMADISRPAAEGKFPTVLIRTPYGRSLSLSSEEWLVSRGYVVVSQDVRGRGGSDGDWDPLVTERKDGYDTLTWVTQQPWSDGKVGMIGGSYLGYVQWAAATSGHPALRCIIPQVSPPQPDKNFPWDNGSFMLLSNLWWCRVVKDRLSTTANAFAELKNLKALQTLPLTKVDDAYFGENIPFFDKWLKRPTLKDWGDVFTTEDVAKVPIPALHISGIWDGDGIGTALHWQARAAGHPNDMLVFGPWTHLFNTSHKYGDQEYGEHGILELDSVYLRFFDKWLKGKDSKLNTVPRVQFFVTGANKWVNTSQWPMPGATARTWALAVKGKSGSLQDKPAVGKATYAYDPLKPAFKADSLEVNVTGDTTVVAERNDGFAFSTAPFAQDTTLAGPIKIDLYVSSTAKDATFQVTVLEQDSTGTARFLGLPGTARATYVDGKIRWLKPGVPVKVEIEPWWFAHTFKKGSRLMIWVASDTYPRFARNPGNGQLDWQATTLSKARHTVWTGPKTPSKVTIWQLPNSRD